MTDLPYSVERSILICARRSTVFRYFQDSDRFADWWGKGSEIEGRPGGKVKIIHPGGTEAGGEVLEVDQDRRIVFTYGYADPARRFPIGSSRVTVTLEDRPEGTWLTLHHDLADERIRDEHVQGWRFQLALFANVASRFEHSAIAERIDRYFALWGEADAIARKQGLAEIGAPDLSFQDQYSCTAGIDDLDAHLAAARVFMPGLTLARTGEPRQCQGAALADWEARSGDGKTVGKGTNLFVLAPDGRINRVVGFWA